MTMKKLMILAEVSLAALRMGGVDTNPKLEHTFSGYYFPYNMEVYNPYTDDDRYFYPSILNIDGGDIYGVIYNEDYTVRDEVNCTISVPTGYAISAVYMGGNMMLPDGTGFFIVVFTKTNYEYYGDTNYAIGRAYSMKRGNPKLFSIGSSTASISCASTLYVINGQLSLLLFEMDYDSSGRSIKYRTKVYSLGEVASNPETEINGKAADRYAIRAYDMNGRLVETESKGTPMVIQYSDGSAEKVIK